MVTRRHADPRRDSIRRWSVTAPAAAAHAGRRFRSAPTCHRASPSAASVNAALHRPRRDGASRPAAEHAAVGNHSGPTIEAPQEGARSAPSSTVFAVGGAGVFAVDADGGQATAGGAASPEELGERAWTRSIRRTCSACIDLLLPGERDTFSEPAQDSCQRADAARGAQPGRRSRRDRRRRLRGSLAARCEADETNVHRHRRTSRRGQINAEVNGEALPIGELVPTSPRDDVDLGELDESTSSELDVPLTAVESDGRWYLSVFYTVAEEARPVPTSRPTSPRAGSSRRVASQPEGALDELFDGLENLDLTAVIAGLNPSEAAALQRYAPLFIDDAQSMLDEAPIELDFKQAEYNVTGDGIRRSSTQHRRAGRRRFGRRSRRSSWSTPTDASRAERRQEFDSCNLDESFRRRVRAPRDMLSEGLCAISSSARPRRSPTTTSRA